MVFEKTLILSSAPARKKDTFNKAEDFEVRYDTPINLGSDKKFRLPFYLLQVLIHGTIYKRKAITI